MEQVAQLVRFSTDAILEGCDMQTQVFRLCLRGLVLSMLMVAGASAALAVDTTSRAQQPAPSKEMRAKMATIHEQMAVCLRSDKPLSECRAEMMKSCQAMMGPRECSAMGMHASHGAMGMHGGTMPKSPGSAPTEQ